MSYRIVSVTVIKTMGARAVGKIVNDDRADWCEAWALFPGSVAYICHAGTKAGIVQDSLAACGFETRSQIIWAKNNFAIGRGHYHCKHEPCWYVVRKGSTASWSGSRRVSRTLHGWLVGRNSGDEHRAISLACGSPPPGHKRSLINLGKRLNQRISQ